MVPSSWSSFGVKIFIASSVEGRDVADAIKAELDQKQFDCALWYGLGVFEVGKTPIESLESVLAKFTHAIIVMSPDDLVISRGQSQAVPRDNLIFESGMFIGRLGRESVFCVVPQKGQLKLPSDYSAIEVCEYNIREDEIPSKYDVATAVKKITDAIKTRSDAGHSARNNPVFHTPQSINAPQSKFWDDLSDTVVVVYGIQPSIDQGSKYPRMSTRDLETAIEILLYLARLYPHKKILTFPGEAPGWPQILERTKTDLIIIGGFVTNNEFERHQQQYERGFRLKMGRICKVEGRQVFHVEFGRLYEADWPSRKDPKTIDDYPSDRVSRDFGIITSKKIQVYGYERRVITIAGIKGNGTRGAGKALTTDDHRYLSHVDTKLPRKLKAADSVEMIVMSRVSKDIVDDFELVELQLNNQAVPLTVEKYWKECELSNPCEGCVFGLLR